MYFLFNTVCFNHTSEGFLLQHDTYTSTSSKEIQLELLSDIFDHNKYSWRVDYSVTPPRTVNNYSILCLCNLMWPRFGLFGDRPQ